MLAFLGNCNKHDRQYNRHNTEELVCSPCAAGTGESNDMIPLLCCQLFPVSRNVAKLQTWSQTQKQYHADRRQAN